MLQYHAGYVLGSTNYLIRSFERNKDQYPQLKGLLNQLSTFDVSGPAETFNETVHPVLAVLNNIITRGLPTLVTERIEHIFSQALQLTTSMNQYGSIKFPLTDALRFDQYAQEMFSLLHLIDPRAKNRNNYLDLNDTDSQFERNFLLQLIPQNKSYLAQLFQHQRTRGSIARNNNEGYVDFSLEIPYFQLSERENRYRQQVEIKCRSCYVVEVDGTAYHNDLIDDLKDFEIAQLPRNINHVRQGNTHRDVNLLLSSVSSEKYVQHVEQKFNDSTWLANHFSAHILSPFLVARIQKTLVEFLIRKQDTLHVQQTIQLAVVERDFPAARISITDLLEQLAALNSLAGEPLLIPKIELTVFSTPEFINHRLQLNEPARLMSECDPSNYDLVLDVSILRRSGIFGDDYDFSSNHTWRIRSSHFTDHRYRNSIYSSESIRYRDVVQHSGNEIHEEISETKSLLQYFLRNIFRKEDFREGQLPILNRALNLKSVIGLLPTGGGKSLTYQLAALLQPGITIVVDPIRSLMVDQFRGLKELGIDRCEFINSTLSAAEKRYNQNKLLPEGQLQFVFVSPERFVIQEFRDALNNTSLNRFYFSYVVIDEVHCVSEWGHDFRTPYLNLGEHGVQFCKTFSHQNIPLFGLTATASFDVLADIERELQIPDDDGNAVVRYENTVRDEINYAVREVNIDPTGLANFSKISIRRLIGESKQMAAFGLIRTKEQLLQRFNIDDEIKRIAEYSWKNYIPDTYKQKSAEKLGGDEAAMQAYISTRLAQLRIDVPIFPTPIQRDDEREYTYGAVVFTPHRQGALGIIDGGLYTNADFTERTLDGRVIYGSDTLGFFMGSGEDLAIDRVDETSFRNLDDFIKNRISLMIATKAFGMGIDKPNVRLTIHMNIPQSIESFVQEAGRAGRDKKLSYSLILFNQQPFPATDGNLTTKDYLLDKDVLMYFHRKSFKGQIKERAMIHELRTQVTYPNITNAQRLSQKLDELYGNSLYHFKVNRGRNNWRDHLFVSANDNINIGILNLQRRSFNTYQDFGDTNICLEIMNIVLNDLPGGMNSEGIGNWLNQLIVNTQAETGIERMLENMTIGASSQLQIPFTNKYYTSVNNREYNLNQTYVELIRSTTSFKRLVEEKHVSEFNFLNHLKTSNKNGETFEEFIQRLEIQDETVIDQLLSTQPIDRLHICYYKGRSQEDTAKAIYRLISIGVIDAYTIDYQNKLYTVYFTKKEPDEYFDAFERLMARYTSRRAANTTIVELRNEFERLQVEGNVTVLSFCLEKLTNFIYGKIREKRMQAIEDMVSLCKTAVTETNDPQSQNEFLKDEIFYYFNAKYSRQGYVEPSTGDEASLVDDRESALSIREVVEKYIRLVEDERTGQLMNNIKHLRGSTMRMIRSYGDEPAYLILKAYSLIVLSTVIVALTTDAKKELIKGMIKWKQQEPSFNPIEFISWFRDMVSKHVYDHIVEEVFTDIEDEYYTGYYLSWTRKFITDKF